ncbi:MAG: inositol monophosphatase family protein [Alphaproteobacteria bacterium]
MDFNSEKVLPILKEAAQKFILPRFQALKDHEISSKTNPTDLVTLADIEAEKFFEEALPSILPSSLVVGEESVSRGDKSLDTLSMQDQYIWVVDPVDGTYNFVHGREDFGIMLSLVYKGENIGGWIYDILNDHLAYALRGEGAYDGCKRVKFANNNTACTSIPDMDVFLSPKFFPKSLRDHIKARQKQFRKAHPLGCAAHEYLNVLRGIRSACIYCRLKPWDHLPGTLMITEAGGYICKWDGKPYVPQDVYGGLIATRSKEQWDAIYECLFADVDFAALNKKI